MLDHILNMVHMLRADVAALKEQLSRTNPGWDDPPPQPDEPTVTTDPDMVGMPPGFPDPAAVPVPDYPMTFEPAPAQTEAARDGEDDDQ